MADKSWRQAIDLVLAEAGGAMHYREIAEAIVARRLRTHVGATPADTVSACVSTSVAQLGERSPYRKTGRGEYMLRGVPGKPASGGTLGPLAAAEASVSERDDRQAQYDIISSFGMFWRRDFVDWRAMPRLLGMQQIGTEAVDFAAQLGIYLLYDGREVIYVGRITERPLGRRLYEHTLDRLATRWDRFSWFGLLPVSEDGVLGVAPEHYAASQLAPALEAVLIEALEPRQNRKRGDDLAAVEYLQQEDPEIARGKRRALLAQMAARV